MSLRAELQQNNKIILPIKKGLFLQAREVFEGFLGCLEESYAQDSFKRINIDTVISDKIITSKKSERCRLGGWISLNQTLFVVEDKKRDLSIPIGAHAIMENYAKHLEHINSLFAPEETSKEYEKHLYYYFLILQIFRLKNIPEEAKRNVVSSIFYIALMGITPIITEPNKIYFGSLHPDGFKQLDTLKILRYPGTVFCDALKATIEIAKDEPAILRGTDFIYRLCAKLNLPSIEELNLQLKRFICVSLERYKEYSFISLFPFVEYYLEMSLKFIELIEADPFSFIDGKITKETALLLSDQNDPKVDRGFIHKYPVPSVLMEHTYDELGRIAEYTGLGDGGTEQLFLELYWDIYEQLFVNKNLYCYTIRHMSTEVDGCNKQRLCDPRNTKLNYDNCSQLHKTLLKHIFGNYNLLQ